MSEISNPHFSVKDLATHLTATVMRHHENSSADVIERAAESAVPQNITPRDAPRLQLQPSFCPANDETHAYHVNDLLQYHDGDFLRNSYRAVLKRVPDAEGFNKYLQRLRSGRINKIDVLASMRYSAEGMAHAVHIKSLRLPSLVRRAGRVPFFGYFIRLVIAIARLPRYIEMQRQADAHAFAQDERIAGHINEVSRHFTDELKGFALHLSNANQSHQQLQTAHTHLSTDHARLATAHTHHVAEQQAHAEASIKLAERMESRIASQEHHLIQLQRAIENAQQALQHARMELTLQQQRISHLSKPATRFAPVITPDSTPSAEAVAPKTDSATVSVIEDDAFYAAFTDRFRGSTEEITRRLRAHLKTIERLPDGEIVDLGSGRGEWLELLREAGREAYGVDTNRLMAEDCRARGLHVIEADALTHLSGLPESSLALVCGFHIIEHLTAAEMTRLLTQTMRTLRHGGVALFETPNPENVLVGSYLFYTDPTHERPLPSSTLRFLLETCGFEDVAITYLHPRETDRIFQPDGADELTARFNDFFYGPMDYSISGRKPAA